MAIWMSACFYVNMANCDPTVPLKNKGEVSQGCFFQSGGPAAIFLQKAVYLTGLHLKIPFLVLVLFYNVPEIFLGQIWSRIYAPSKFKNE